MPATPIIAGELAAQAYAMKRVALIALTVPLALAAGAGGTRYGPRADAAIGPSSTIEARQALAQARGEAARARARAAALDRQARSALLAGDKAMLAAAALAARVQQAEAALAAADADLARVGATRRMLARRLARENAPVAQLLAGLQTQVRHPPLLHLLQPGSITDAVHMRAVLTAVEPQLRRRTSALRGDLSRARTLEQEAARIAMQRRALQRNLLARRGELAASSAAERLKARRASAAADREAERAFALAASASDLTTLVRRLEADPDPSPAASFSSANRAAGATPRPVTDLTLPHRMPVQGQRAAVQPSPRLGLTLEPRPGALVIAPGPGRVAFAGPYRGYGDVVILEHAGGWTSTLTGLADAQVAVGQTVMAGSPLGSAASLDPRITVELRRSGEPIDPRMQLR